MSGLSDAAQNRGVAHALELVGRDTDPVFVGRELTVHSRSLPETEVMDYVISHDFAGELAVAVKWIKKNVDGVVSEPSHSQILVHTRYNCAFS